MLVVQACQDEDEEQMDSLANRIVAVLTAGKFLSKMAAYTCIYGDFYWGIVIVICICLYLPVKGESPENKRLRKAKRDGLALQSTDFILLSATVHGRKARRNAMIPSLIKCMEDLRPEDCVSLACNRAIRETLEYFQSLSLENCGQVPWLQNNLLGKFCIGKIFCSTAKSQNPAKQTERVPVVPVEQAENVISTGIACACIVPVLAIVLLFLMFYLFD